MDMQVLAQTTTADWPNLFNVLPIIFLLVSIFWIWVLIDCATNANLDGTHKLIWVLIVLFLHWLGALIYFFVARRTRPRTAGS